MTWTWAEPMGVSANVDWVNENSTQMYLYSVLFFIITKQLYMEHIDYKQNINYNYRRKVRSTLTKHKNTHTLRGYHSAHRR